MDNVNIEIKSEQIEITKSDGQYILLRKCLDKAYIAQFSHEVTENDIRRLSDTGVIAITHNEGGYFLYLKTIRFHSTEMLYLIMADVLKYKNLITINHE